MAEPQVPPESSSDEDGFKHRRRLLLGLALAVGLYALGGVAIAVMSPAGGGAPPVLAQIPNGEASGSAAPTGLAASAGPSALPVVPVGPVPQGSAPAVAGRPGLGSAVRDGTFEFVVARVRCGREHVGDATTGESAHGRFCVVKLSVTNVGGAAQTFDDSAQCAYDEAGTKFDADTTGDLAVNPGMWATAVNPGDTVTGFVLFDVPRSEKIARVELHDSILSDGVTVRLEH